MADPTQIRQLIVNLCTNAADAVGNQKGAIEVSLKPVVLGPENMGGVKNLEPGPYLELTVTDSGPGMEQKVKDRVFDPFFTTKAAGEGMGMGLAVIHGIVKACGGDIQVESEPGEGTSFHLFFPCLELDETEKPKEKAPLPLTESIPCGNERLLFVDDENMLVDVHREILERLGYDVVTAANGFEALEVFSADPARVDLAIVDYAMPGMTGVELSRKLLKIRAELPIILCTGLTKTTICQEAMAVGIKEFIMKPIIMKDLAAVIRDVLEKKNKEE